MGSGLDSDHIKQTSVRVKGHGGGKGERLFPYRKKKKLSLSNCTSKRELQQFGLRSH